MILGITGGSGCGKTTLLALLSQCGALVLDCDAIYHRLLQTDHLLLAAIQSRFPQAVDSSGLDRKKLGDIVFHDSAALLELNSITHAAVREEVLRQIEGAPALAAIDAYALFQGNLAPLCDVTVAITAPQEARIQRLVSRDGIAPEYARSRILSQPSEAWFRQRCDYVLDNNGTLSEFQKKCLSFLEELNIITDTAPC